MAKVSTRHQSGRNSKPLPPDHAHFVHLYDATGGNGTRAYLGAFPACKSINAAAASAYKLRRRPEIAAAIDALQEARWKKLQMGPDEAAARIALDARADIRDLYDEDGELLPIHQWPDSIAQSVKAIRPGKDGTTVVLNDSLAARRVIAEMTGKLKGVAGAVGDLARILAGDFTEDE